MADTAGPIPVVDAAEVAALEAAADNAAAARPANTPRPRMGGGEPASTSAPQRDAEAGAGPSPSEGPAPAIEPPTKPPIYMIGPDGVPRILIDPEEYARDRERLARVERYALHTMNIAVCLAELFRIAPQELQQAYAATAAEERRIKTAKAPAAAPPPAPTTTTTQ